MKVSKTSLLNRIREFLKKSKRGVVSIPLYQLSIDYDAGIDTEENYEHNIALLENMLPELKHLKGVDYAKLEKCSYTTFLRIIRKPCREFESLQNYMDKYAKCRFTYDFRCTESLSGKRSSMDITEVSMLCHNAPKCKEIHKWLKENKVYNKKCIITVDTDTYYGDRFNSYGEDMECEWSGYRTRTITITLYTPTGRISAMRKF